jgi:hypothetical protein
VTEQEHALVGIARSLDELAVPYAVIGGLANAVWGEPRSTLDVDVAVRVEERRLAKVIGQLAGRFHSLAPDPRGFVARTSVLPLRSSGGVRIDVIFARLPFEEEVIRRAVPIEMSAAAVRFCTAEDLILMKVASERPRDLDDARGVALRRMRELDLAYLEPRLGELSELLERPDIMARWSAWRTEAGSPPPDP